MRIDWQAYMDGSLSDSERVVAEQMLLSDPKARRELEGLENFVSTIRNVGISEDVPMERLNALLPAYKKQAKRSWIPRLAFGATMAAAAAMAAILIAPRILGPERNELETSNPVTATAWAAKHLQMDIPVMDLGSGTELFLVHEGKGKCCFDYKVHGDTYHVNVRPDNRGMKLEGQPVTLQTGVPAGLGRGVRWREKNYEFFIVGPKPDTSLDLANRTSKLLVQRA